MSIEKHMYKGRGKRMSDVWKDRPCFSFRMPQELFQRMQQHKSKISWASFLREAVESALNELEKGTEK